MNDTLIEQTDVFWSKILWMMYESDYFHILRRFGFLYRYFDKKNGKCKADYKQTYCQVRGIKDVTNGIIII